MTAAVAALLTAAPAAADPIGDIEAEIEAQAADLEVVIEEYNAISEELADTKEQIAALEEELAPYEEKLEELYDATEGIVTHAYQTQGLSGTFAVLNAGSPELFSERMTALNGATAGDAALIAEVTEAKAVYEEDMGVLDDLRATQAEQEAALEEQKTTIEEGIERLQADRKDAYRDEAAARGESIDYIPDYIPGDRGLVVRHAMAQLGKSYVWATSGPDTYDCSGLMLAAYNAIGIGLPHNAAAQYNMSTRISRDALQPGDLVFYNGLAHVAMYIGDGYVIHAPTTGDVVKIQPLDEAATPYYGAGRFL
ncbi:NlpC/P60 family protein [Stackebrandtia albiflava]